LSAGTVKISPRASKRARLPVGDSDAHSIRRVTSAQRGVAQGRSPRTSITSWRSAPSRVEEMHVAGLLVDQHPAAAAQRLDVVVLVARDLGDRPRREVIAPQVHGEVAVERK